MNPFSRSVRQVIGNTYIISLSCSRENAPIYEHLMGELVILAKYFDTSEVTENQKGVSALNILMASDPRNINKFTIAVRETYKLLGIHTVGGIN